MRRTQRIVTVSMLLSGAVAGAASAQERPFDVPGIKPVVMLLVDTSGSMERKPVADTDNPDDTFPQCGTNSERNRWAITLEALTGSFAPYSCVEEERTLNAYKDEYDFGYHIPHANIQPGVGSLQPYTDGLLDSYVYNIKFGVMTFDGVGTLAGRKPLMTAGEWDSIKDDDEDGSRGVLGMYSYGPDRELTYPNCPDPYWVNFGARGRGAFEGALVDAEASDDATPLKTANDRVQQSLLAVRPYGGTPIAAILDDLNWALKEDQVVVGGINDDPYGACRERYAVLLTDGAPDPLFRGDSRINCEDVDGCPYPKAEEVARDLIGPNKLSQLFVVALNVADDDALDQLKEIAEAGGTELLEATDLTALRRKLNSVFEGATDDSSTRSIPVVTSSGFQELSDNHDMQFEQQWEITSGFRVGEIKDGNKNEPWEGLLYRRRFLCSGELDSELRTEDQFHEVLDVQSATTGGRQIYTIVPDPVQAARGTVRSEFYAPNGPNSNVTPVAYSNTVNGQVLNERAPDGQDTLTTAPVLSADDSITQARNAGQNQQAIVDEEPVDFVSGNLTYDLLGVPTNDSAAIDHIVGYVKGTTEGRVGRTLGDIYHSNPVVLPPLVENSRFLSTTDEKLNAFLKDLAGPGDAIDVYGAEDGRPGVVFVGTNDGLLHSFNLDDWKAKEASTETRAGWEFWGFVPPALLGKLHTTAIPTHQEMFDGTPQVRNMLLARDSNGPIYRTVLVSALRGTAAFVALDVTYPDQKPIFLWQFSSEKLGNTVGAPALTQARIQWTSSSTDIRERALAILPGGVGVEDTTPDDASCGNLEDGVTRPKPASAIPPATTPPAPRTKVRCWKHRGRVLYVVDVATGTVVQEFDSRHFPAPLTGAVVVDGEGLEISKAAYFTDQDGLLWRLAMVDPDPNKWRVEPIYDVFAGAAYDAGRPAIYGPTLSRDELGNNVILVGTGDLDNLQDSVANRVVSLTEKRALDADVASDGLGFGGEILENWKIVLNPGESVTGPINIYDSVAYYGTFRDGVSSGNDCSTIGNSRLWGVHYMLKTDAPEGEATSDWPKEMLVRDTSSTTIDHTWFIEGFDNSLLFGVNISAGQMCVGGALVNDMYAPGTQGFQANGNVTGGSYQLRAMMGGQGADSASNQSIGDLNQFQRSVPVTRHAKMVGWGGSVD